MNIQVRDQVVSERH